MSSPLHLKTRARRATEAVLRSQAKPVRRLQGRIPCVEGDRPYRHEDNLVDMLSDQEDHA